MHLDRIAVRILHRELERDFLARCDDVVEVALRKNARWVVRVLERVRHAPAQPCGQVALVCPEPLCDLATVHNRATRPAPPIPDAAPAVRILRVRNLAASPATERRMLPVAKTVVDVQRERGAVTLRQPRPRSLDRAPYPIAEFGQRLLRRVRH